MSEHPVPGREGLVGHGLSIAWQGGRGEVHTMWDFSDAEEVEIEEEKKPDEPEEKPSPEEHPVPGREGLVGHGLSIAWQGGW
jgi:minor histocompatibility antigen H13